VSDFESVKEAFEGSDYNADMVLLSMLPKEMVTVSDDDRSSLTVLFEALEEDDDAQDVYSNLS